MDPRIRELAEILVDYSSGIKKGQTVQIVGDVVAEPLIKELYVKILRKGAYPRVHAGIQGLNYLYYKNASKEQLEHFPSLAMAEIKKTDAIFYIQSSLNKKELSSIAPSKVAKRQKVLKPITEHRVKHTNWVITLFPTPAYAQDADMSLSEFEDFVYSATNLNWRKMANQNRGRMRKLQKAKTIRIRAANTDISMSIKGMKWVMGDGKNNMPCGEIFTAPVKESVEGHIEYEYPAVYNGNEVEGVKLEFRKGKVEKFSATKNEKFLKHMIEMDSGSAYLGELGIGTNYGIKKYIKNILFDEKIGGTIHLALGQAYEACNGKNKSALHWDMIKDLRRKGEIMADGKIVQRNGKFLI